MLDGRHSGAPPWAAGLSGPFLGSASPARRAALLAEAGLWYDAVAAAADLGQQTALDALMSEVGLTRPVAGSIQSSAVMPSAQ